MPASSSSAQPFDPSVLPASWTRDDGRRLSRTRARALDRAALEEFGVPGLVLMEHAARSVVELVERAWPGPGRALVFCGGGNNGGDGFAIARGLADRGWRVHVLATADTARARGDAAVERAIAARARIPIERFVATKLAGDAFLAHADAMLGGPAHLVIDALLGTGFAPRGPDDQLGGDVGAAVDAIAGLRRERGAQVIAVDVPSGLDADTGLPARPTVAADVTATFVARKTGFDAPQAAACLGRVVVLPIWAPRALIERYTRLRGEPG